MQEREKRTKERNSHTFNPSGTWRGTAASSSAMSRSVRIKYAQYVII